MSHKVILHIQAFESQNKYGSNYITYYDNYSIKQNGEQCGFQGQIFTYAITALRSSTALPEFSLWVLLECGL